MTVTPSTERRAALELAPERIHADTPAEFRQLLDHIRTRAGLTPGQIAVKTGIPRSQAYNMVSASRTTLPSKPEQVQRFVEACGLGAIHVAMVMDLWKKLDQENRANRAKPTTAEPAPIALAALAQALKARTEAGAGSTPLTLSDNFKIHNSVHGWQQRNSLTQDLLLTLSNDRRRARKKGLTQDLLFTLSNDPQRARNMTIMLWPIAFMVVGVAAALVSWAVLQPAHAPLVAAIFLTTLLIPVLRSLGRQIEFARHHKTMRRAYTLASCSPLDGPTQRNEAPAPP